MLVRVVVCWLVGGACACFVELLCVFVVMRV